MAVSEHVEDQGLGKQLVQALEREVLSLGIRHVELHARCHVQGFYERLEYTPCSDIYNEVGIPHITMEKYLET